MRIRRRRLPIVVVADTLIDVRLWCAAEGIHPKSVVAYTRRATSGIRGTSAYGVEYLAAVTEWPAQDQALLAANLNAALATGAARK